MSEGHDYLSKYLVPNSTMMNRAGHRKKGKHKICREIQNQNFEHSN